MAGKGKTDLEAVEEKSSSQKAKPAASSAKRGSDAVEQKATKESDKKLKTDGKPQKDATPSASKGKVETKEREKAKAKEETKTKLDPKTKSDPKVKPDPKLAKGESSKKSKEDSKAKTAEATKEKKVSLKLKTGKESESERPVTPEGDGVEGEEGEEREEEAQPYVNPFKIDNVYAHYMEKHPPRKPWSFDMNPPRPPKVRPILDPFKWSKKFIQSWGEERTKDPETIAEEERLEKLEEERLAKKYIRPCKPEEHSHKRVSIYCQPSRLPIYKLDIYGNPVLDETSQPIYEPIYMLNTLGKKLLDAQGKPIPVYLMDDDGNVVLDLEGNPIPGPTYTLDVKGDPLLDEMENMILEPEHEDLLDEEGNVVLDEHGHPRHKPRPIYMLNADGRVMLDKDENRILGRPFLDVAGEVVMGVDGRPVLGRFQFGELDENGELLFDKEGNVIMDEEGAPLYERQESRAEKKARLRMEAEARKAKFLEDKVESEREMMHTPLSAKAVPWKKYFNAVYIPRCLKMVVYKNRGVPGDDWKKFVKKYTIAEMNHRMAVQLHGETAVLWRKLHEHVTYVQNPRYAAEIKQIKGLRIFEIIETEEGQKCDLIDPHVLIFDGFEPGKTYTRHLRIYNVSPWTQRLRVIKPQTLQYFISSPEEQFQGKSLVSGHKCDFDVFYQPPTVWKYEDVVVIKTEMQSLPLKLKAINPYPVVVLPEFVDMGLCLSGHAVCYHYTLTSEGAGAGFSFSTFVNVNDYHPAIEDPRYDDLRESYRETGILYIPPFLVYPRTFDTTPESKQEFIFLFRPPRAGVYHYIVQLTTATNLHWEIKVKGTAVDLELDLTQADGKDFNPGQLDLGLAFGQVTVSHHRIKTLTVKSSTAVPLRFYWRIQDRHVNFTQEEDPEGESRKRERVIVHLREFVPNPEEGIFNVRSQRVVEFKFTPSDLSNYHAVAALYVDTRSNFPLSSDVWRNFREALRYLEYEKATWLADQPWAQRVLWGIDRSGFQCSEEVLPQSDLKEIVAKIDKIFHITQIENSGTIFRIAEVDLAGAGTQFDVEICPKVYQFSGILTLGETHLGEIEIVNRSPTSVIFTWDRPRTPHGVVRNAAYVYPLTGQIEANSAKSIQLTMKARKVGRIELELHCLVESPVHLGKHPLSLMVEGHVVGPNVILSPAVLDFGLVQIDSTHSLEITLTNKSEYADAPFKIFSTRDSQLPFSSPFIPESQMNPSSPSTKVPFGSGLFDEELNRKPQEVKPLRPPLVTLLPGHSKYIAGLSNISVDQQSDEHNISESAEPSTLGSPAARPALPSNTCEKQGTQNGKSEKKPEELTSTSRQVKGSSDNQKKSKEERKSSAKSPSLQPEGPSSGLNGGSTERRIPDRSPQLNALSDKMKHASCAPYYKEKLIIPLPNPLDKDVAPEFVPALQERAWISRAFGENLQVFNDGMTNPKLPSTTLFQPKDPTARLPPLQIPPVPQPMHIGSGIAKGISDLMEKKIIPAQAGNSEVQAPAASLPAVKSPRKTTDQSPSNPAEKSSVKPADESPSKTVGESPSKTAGESPSKTVGESPSKTAGESPSKPADGSPITVMDEGSGDAKEEDSLPTVPSDPARYLAFIDLNGTGLNAQREAERVAHPDKKKPFLEQMGHLGCFPRYFGPNGPPIFKTVDGGPVYEEDLRQLLIFEPEEGIVPKGNKSIVIKVTLTGTICGFMRLAILCEISKGLSPTQYAIARANIDAPEACLIPPFMDLRTKFINIPITINVVIRNLKALPACYSWPWLERVGEVKDLDVEVIIQRGEIPPRQEWSLTIKLIPRKLGPLDTILICNVYKMINPLGLKLKAFIVDARISYHVFRPDKEDGQQKSGRKVAHDRILLKRQQEAMGNPVEEEDPDNWVDPPVPCLDFGRRRELGRAHCLKLLLCNHSPIEVKVKLTVARYMTEPLASLVKDECWVISSITERLSYLIPNRRDPFQKSFKRKEMDKTSQFHLNTPSLSDLSDSHLKFFGQAGKEKIWRRAEGAMHEALIKEGMPVAFMCYPSYTGVIKPWSNWSAEVMCFSNLPGNYIDVLTSKVGRLDPVYLPLEVEIIGTPLVARRNWLEPTGLQQPEDEAEISLVWQPIPAGHHVVTRQFWVRNQSPFHMEVKWEFKRQATIEGGKFVSMNFVIENDLLAHAICVERPEWCAEDPCAQVVVKEHIAVVYEQKVHCVFRDYLETLTKELIEPNTLPFQLVPQQQVILGHSSYPFEVRFSPTIAKSFSYVLAGYHRIYDGKTSERRRSTRFVFDSTFDRKDDQYVYRRPEKKHVCEHVVSFFSQVNDSFAHTLAHKTTIVDPPDPEIRALELNDDGTKPRRLSRFHCSSASNSSSSDDEKQLQLPIKPPKPGRSSKIEKQRQSRSKVLKFLDANAPGSSDGEETDFQDDTTVGDSKEGKTREGKFSQVHNIAYESESEEEEPKYQFDIKRRSSRTRRVSLGRDVAFHEPSEDSSADTYDPPEEKDWKEMPSVDLDLSETMATRHAKEFFSFDAIRPLRVSLEAVVLLPRLKTSIDDSIFERVSFQCFGNDSPDSRLDVQSLYVTNVYAHKIFFGINIPKDFGMLNIRRGVLLPVEHGDRCQRMSIFPATDRFFSLEAGHSLQFNLTFRPVVDDCLLDPKDFIIEENFRIDFYGTEYDQLIPLRAEVLFPELRLMEDTVCLGDVVYAFNTQAMDFTLSNPSLPDADWRIVTEETHAQTIALAASGVSPKWEDSAGLNKVWPIIWSANPERGTVRGRRENDLGPGNEIQYYRNNNVVTVSFAPFDPVDYELPIWVEVRLGRGVQLTLKGTGTEEPPPTPPPKPAAADDKKKGKGKDAKKGAAEGKGAKEKKKQ